MKKILIHLASASLLLGVFAVAAHAANLPAGGDTSKIDNPLGSSTNSLAAFFDTIVGVAIELGTIVSVLAIMYGGFLYVSAQGNEEQLAKAYKTITWALVGTAVLLGSRTIMAAVSGTVKELGKGI